MKHLNEILIIISLSFGGPLLVHAQDSAELSQPTVKSGAPDDLDSGYVRKPKSKHRKSRGPASESEAAVAPTPAPSPGAAGADAKNPQGAPLPGLAGENFNNTGSPQPQYGLEPQRPASWGRRMQDMFLGGDPETLDKYRSYLDTEDIRKNILEFTLASSYMYNSSLSSYYPRNYIDSGPAAMVGIDIWVTPFFGIDATYRSTILNEIQDTPVAQQYLAATQNWFGLGLKFRRFFGMAANAPSMVVGLKFSDYTLSLPPSALYRSNQTMQGPELDIDLSVPAGKRYSWLFGLVAEPYLTAAEANRMGSFLSGTSNQTAAFGANVGGEYRLSRQTSAFFKFSTMFYMSQFSGAASGADPTTGATPNGVPVSNMFYFIDLGVKLGR